MKNFKNILAVIIFFGLACFLPKSTEALTANDAYKGIVQIYTYAQETDYNFELKQTGTGILLNLQGLILTNEHVVSYKDSITGKELPVGLRVCLTTEVNSVPDCNYSADILAKDATKDTALLRIKSSKVAEVPSVDFIRRASDTDRLTSGDTVHVWGYPGIGGKTITNTSGSFSGRETAGGVEVLKTDTTVSFGSSGGAMLNDQGELIGLISFINEDSGGTIAYAVDIEELNSWIEQNKDNKVSETGFEKEFQMVLKEFIMYTGKNPAEKFEDTEDGFSMTRLSNWSYQYSAENSLVVAPKNSNTDAVLSLLWVKTGVEAKYILDQFEKGVKVLIPSCTNLGGVFVDEILGRHVVCSIQGNEINYYMVPVKNRLFVFLFGYGADNQAWDEVRAMLDSIRFDESKIDFTQKTSYVSDENDFRLETTDDWGILTTNSIREQISGFGKDGKSFTLLARETTTQKTQMTNEEYFNFVLEDDEVSVGQYDDYNIFDKDFSVKLNDSITNTIRYNYEMFLSDKPKSYVAVYYIRTENNVIQVRYNYMGDNRNDFIGARTGFEQQVLSGLSVDNQLVSNQDDNEIIELEIIEKTLQGRLIKGESSSAVYLLMADNKRYVFPNEKVYYSWFNNFNDVQTITDEELASYGLGGNLTFAPGTLIKIPSVPKVFVIVKDNKIRWIETENAAKRFFGSNWNKKVKDVGASYFLNYEEIESVK